MKKLIFIDNDFMDRSQMDSRRVQRMMGEDGSLSDAYISKMKLVPEFSRMKEDKAFAMLFSPKNAIVTYSMYTYTHYNSLGQVFKIFEIAAISDVKGVTFIDGSGNFLKDVGDKLKDSKYAVHIMVVVESNFIVSFMNGKWVRIRVKISGLYDSPFTTEPVSLKDVLK